MKLYYFNPNNYGQEYFVVSDSPENALASLLNHLKEKAEKESKGKTRSTFDRHIYNVIWKNAIIKSLPEKYTLEVHEPGEIVQSEIS